MQETYNNQLLSNILDAVPEPLFVKDSAHRWVYGNTPFWEILGAGGSDAYLGKTDHDIFPKAEADIFWEVDDAVIQNKEVIQNEENITRADGTTINAMTKKSPFTLPDGTPGLIGIIHDITDLRKTEHELIAAKAENIEKNSFLATMTHEILTPLNGVIGMAEVLAGTSLTDDQRANLGVIQSSGQALNTMISSIFSLTRLQAGRMMLDTYEDDLRDEVIETVTLFHKAAQRKGLSLKLSLSPTLPARAEFDALRLRECLSHLIDNAVKFTATGGVRISVRHKTRGAGTEQIQVQVKDSGIGMDAAQVDEAFIAFRQLDNRHERLYGGNGVGLAVAKGIAELMGGSIHVVSAPGRGSIFTLNFNVKHVVATAAQFGAAS